jgi:hypothetical protein
VTKKKSFLQPKLQGIELFHLAGIGNHSITTPLIHGHTHLKSTICLPAYKVKNVIEGSLSSSTEREPIA